jgi:hypothetical protein
MPTQTTSVVLATLQGGTTVDVAPTESTTTVALKSQDGSGSTARSATSGAANTPTLPEVETTATSTSTIETSVALSTQKPSEGTAVETAPTPLPAMIPSNKADSCSSLAPPTDNKALFKHLVKILEVTPEQAAALKDSRFVAQEMDEILQETLSVLTELRSRLTQCGEDLETEFNNVRSILTPSQSAKFLVWVSQNKACMHMLNELWSKVYPSSENNGCFGDDIMLAPSGESSP